MASVVASKRLSVNPSHQAPASNSRNFLRRLTSRFGSKKSGSLQQSPSLALSPPVPAPSTSSSIPTSESNPVVWPVKAHRGGPVGASMVASASATSLSAKNRVPANTTRSPTRDSGRSRSKSPTPSRKSGRTQDGDKRSQAESRGRQKRRMSAGEQSLKSFTFPALPASSSIPPSPLSPTGISTNDNEEQELTTAEDADGLPGSPSDKLPPIQTAPSLVFSDSEDSHPVASPTTPLTAGLSSDPSSETRGRSNSGPTAIGDSLLTIEVGLRQDSLHELQPAVVISPTTEEPDQFDIPRSASPTSLIPLAPKRERSLERVEEDEEDEEDPAAGESKSLSDPKASTTFLQPESRVRARTLSATSANSGGLAVPGRVTPKRTSTFELLTRAPSKLFGRKDKSATRPTTVYATGTDENGQPAAATTTRKTTILRSRPVHAATLPVRAPTTRGVMTNSDIGMQMDGLMNKASLEVADTSKETAVVNASTPVMDAETQRLTEFAFF